MTKKLIALIMAIIMVLAVVASCGDKKTEEVSQFTVQIGPQPETLDPALNSAVDGGNMLITLFETLLIIDQDNKVQPGQAASYTVSEDGLTWVFTMRENLKWSDGSALDAKDFEYSWKRIADPKTAAPYADTVLNMIAGYDEVASNGIDALQVKASEDGKTLTVKLAYPCAYFDKIVSFGTMSPVNKATIEKNGDAWATKPETFVCNGPYMIESWTASEKIVTKKNANYNGGWDKTKIVTEKINFLLLEDSAASYAAYTNGTAQMIKDVPTEEIPSLKKSTEGGEFYVDTILGTYYLNMNLTKAPFNNVNFRKALSLAIDRAYIANTLMQGTYTAAYNFTGPGVVDAEGMFFDNSKKDNDGKTYISTDYEANKTAAKEALATALTELGYASVADIPAITYSTNDSGYHKVVAEYLQKCYSEVLGITNFKVEIVEWKSFTPQRRAGNYDMARNGWVMDYNDASNMIELFESTNGNNDGKFNSTAFDAAMASSRVADQKAHFEALHDAEEIINTEYACIPVAYYNDYWLQSSTLKGTWHSPYGYWYFQYGYIQK